jgi:next-to-BRCA1 protein 1
VQECSDVLSYLEDLSIPDGSQTEPNASLDKRWSVQNNGTCNWGEGYTIRLISGAEMGAEPTQALIPARAGSDAVIRIQFIAPEEPGTYISAWQAFTPAGLPFGDQFFINIVVANP